MGEYEAGTVGARPELSSAVEFLRSCRNPDGGWGYAPGSSSTVEPVAAVILALRNDEGSRDLVTGALEWLLAGQHTDGGWGITHEDPESGWQTAWGVLALAHVSGRTDKASKGSAWLLGIEPLPLRGDGLEVGRTKLRLDGTLHGWPWQPKQADWIEPTALTMLALHVSQPDPRGLDRLAEGVRFLQDRRCAGGGWNFGNPFMVGAYLPPRAHPTAWVLAALAQIAPGAVEPEDTAALESELARDRGPLAQAWGALALRLLGRDDAFPTERLRALQTMDGGWNQNPYLTAVALMALRGYL